LFVQLTAGDDTGDYMTADEMAAAKHKADILFLLLDTYYYYYYYCYY